MITVLAIIAVVALAINAIGAMMLWLMWFCPKCGSHHDRDQNAAINILNRGLELLED